MYQYFLLVVFMWASVASAQEQVAVPKKKGSNLFLVSYSGQYYFDKNSIKADGVFPEKHSVAKNTFGTNYGLQFEHTTRYGLIVGAGLRYGSRRYDISIRQDMTNFDTSAVNDLNGYVFNYRKMITVNYWSYGLTAGYKMRLNKGIAVVAKGGMSKRNFYDGSSQYSQIFLQYLHDNGYTHLYTQFLNIQERFGRDPDYKHRGFIGRYKFPANLFSFDMYVGIEKEINRSFIKNISVGIEGTKYLSNWQYDGQMTIWSRPSISTSGFTREDFYDRNLSLGLRIAVGLWK